MNVSSGCPLIVKSPLYNDGPTFDWLGVRVHRPPDVTLQYE